MIDGFYRWSESELGQWHYAIGYVITLVSHNWPILIAVAGCCWFGWRAYVHPSRLTVSWLLTSLLFGLAYEYEKHVAGELHRAIDFLFGLEIAAWNRPLHLLIGSVANTILLLAFLILLAQSIRLTVQSRRKTGPDVSIRAGGPHPLNRDDTRAPGA
jgi:hypothetical protein